MPGDLTVGGAHPTKSRPELSPAGPDEPNGFLGPAAVAFPEGSRGLQPLGTLRDWDTRRRGRRRRNDRKGREEPSPGLLRFPNSTDDGWPACRRIGGDPLE